MTLGQRLWGFVNSDDLSIGLQNRDLVIGTSVAIKYKLSPRI